MSFIDTLRKLNKGRLADELDEALSELVGSCASTGKKGSLTLKLTMKPGKGATPVMTVDHDINCKAPNFDRPTEYLFVAPGNVLVVQNPDQGTLNLTVAGGNAARGEPITDEDGVIIGYKKPEVSAVAPISKPAATTA